MVVLQRITFNRALQLVDVA